MKIFSGGGGGGGKMTDADQEQLIDDHFLFDKHFQISKKILAPPSQILGTPLVYNN